MKIKNFRDGLTLILVFLAAEYSYSQTDPTKYRRSSLTMVLIENEGLGDKRDLVMNSYYAFPFPEKYNNHEIVDKKFDLESLNLTTQDYQDAGFYKDTLKTIKDFLKAAKKPLNPLRYTKADSSQAVQEPTKEELMYIYIQKYIGEKNIAKQVVANWFDRKPNGDMSWDVIKERGMYSASAKDLEDASTAASAVDYLLDFELIGNTYTVFNRLEFFPNEPVARDIRDKAKEEAAAKFAGKPELLLTKANQAIDAVYEKTKEGYTVVCNTYLYQLEWNDSIAQKTKDIFFNSAVSIDKIKTWDTLNLFKMKFVGKTRSASIVTFKLGEKRTEEQIIDLQIKRTIDNALSKLQKEYVQFRPVAPIAGIGPLTAKIGVKEGLEPGQTFEVLEPSTNELGLPVWKSIGKVSVDKKVPVWDNTIGAEPLLDESGNPITTPEYSTFKGGDKSMPGFHFIRLIK